VTTLWILAAEGATDTAPPNPVIPVMNELFWAAIFFFALWAMMKFVLLPPIVGAMEKRAATIQSGKDAADAATAALGEARRDHAAALAAARAAADERRAVLQAEADAEIAEMRRSAQAEIEQARAEALTGMRSDVASLAVGAASVVLGADIDAAAQQNVIDQALSAN
jgi:F-type H+-transporting ATPase subunit b